MARQWLPSNIRWDAELLIILPGVEHVANLVVGALKDTEPVFHKRSWLTTFSLPAGHLERAHATVQSHGTEVTLQRIQLCTHFSHPLVGWQSVQPSRSIVHFWQMGTNVAAQANAPARCQPAAASHHADQASLRTGSQATDSPP